MLLTLRMLDFMSDGGSLEILMQVCRMDSGTIFACRYTNTQQAHGDDIRPHTLVLQFCQETQAMSHPHAAKRNAKPAGGTRQCLARQ
jgi:hypothetical protein